MFRHFESYQCAVCICAVLGVTNLGVCMFSCYDQTYYIWLYCLFSLLYLNVLLFLLFELALRFVHTGDQWACVCVCVV